MNNDKAKHILKSSRYATISTVDEGGLPWAAPVWYVVDEHNNIFWWSPIASQHSKNIKIHPNVYITIFDSTLPEGSGVGLYIRANTSEIEGEEEIKKAMDLYNNSTEIFKLSLDNCLGKAPTRIYKAIPTMVWMNSDGEIDGEYIDKRNKLD